jgi:hypothetical protein
MVPIAADSSPNANLYRSLRVDFDIAYRRMMDSSREFNAVLMCVPAGLSPEEWQTRKDRAALAYEDAHEQFMAAVAKLNEFMVGQIISSRATLQSAAAPRVIRTASNTQSATGR